ncbi:GNAT family N-acetyltransferase [Haliea sp. E1-2-M8]|uniref:GNAT family N-acetyltransferase n=1 Tax=Haliea sp. E1-2-M8 TaxID=3064706 RepID=UPI0027205F88|nr:GNAT family N-acetyltransferase [Haliea sp. E1-2-M8]MDO8861055.1 GNAT family N-acetyltransferase [Haliea sp. E1-2-M8]
MLKARDTIVPDILPLSDMPQAIDILAEAHLAEWRELYPEDTVASFAEDLAHSLGTDPVPSTWVLVAGSAVIGSVSLVEQDLDSRPELTPWLANLWVDREWRGRGLGKRLVLHACEQGRLRGLERLYLYTPEHAAFYQALGWETLAISTKNGVPITLMSKLLQRGPRQ